MILIKGIIKFTEIKKLKLKDLQVTPGKTVIFRFYNNPIDGNLTIVDTTADQFNGEKMPGKYQIMLEIGSPGEHKTIARIFTSNFEEAKKIGINELKKIGFNNNNNNNNGKQKNNNFEQLNYLKNLEDLDYNEHYPKDGLLDIGGIISKRKIRRFR